MLRKSLHFVFLVLKFNANGTLDLESICQDEWMTTIKNRYHRANHAQMIVVESQLANLEIHGTPNIINQITSCVTPRGASFLGKQVNRSSVCASSNDQVA